MILESSCFKRWHAISILLANDPWLLDYLFSNDRTRLGTSALELLSGSGDLSSEEQLLIKIALDIWSDEGNAPLGDILHILDSIRFESFMLALEFYRYGRQQ